MDKLAYVKHKEMEAKSKREDIDPASASVCQIYGEPAIRINGVPDLPPNVRCPDQFAITSDPEEAEESCLGEWLEGRTVRKLFGDEYYTGKVVKFDREMRWYRVVYDDGDSEDLEWHELKDVLQPLDISVPFDKLIPKYSKNGKPLQELAGHTVRLGKSNTSSVKKAVGQRSCGSKKKLKNIKDNFKSAKVSENLEETERQMGQNVRSRKRGRPKKVDNVSLEPNEHHLSDLEKTTDLIKHTERVISEGSSYETIKMGRPREVDKMSIESSMFHPSKMENDEQTEKLTPVTQASKSEECNLLKPVKYDDDDAGVSSLETAALVIESIISSITQTENQDKNETPDP